MRTLSIRVIIVGLGLLHLVLALDAAPVLAQRDTTFLYCNANDDFYDRIFVDSSHETYEALTRVYRDEYSWPGYTREYWRLRDSTQAANRTIRIDPAAVAVLKGDWIRVYNFRGREFLYLPNERFGQEMISITDSTIIDQGMEGPNPHIILTVQLATKQGRRIEEVIIYEGGTKADRDTLTFDFQRRELRWLGSRFIPRDSMRHYPVIVHDASMKVLGEWDFDTGRYTGLPR